MVGEDLFLEFDCVVGAARGQVGGGEVCSCGEGFGVVGAEDLFAVGEDLFFEFDCVVGAARRPVGGGEVCSCAQGVGVVGAEDAFTVGCHTLAELYGLAVETDLSEQTAAPQSGGSKFDQEAVRRRTPIQSIQRLDDPRWKRFRSTMVVSGALCVGFDCGVNRSIPVLKCLLTCIACRHRFDGHLPQERMHGERNVTALAGFLDQVERK